MEFDLATTVNLISAIAIVAGVIFAIAELRQAGQDRRNAAAVTVVGAAQTQEIRQAVRDILDLSDRVNPEHVRNDPDLRNAALAVDSACDMWGSMVFEGVVDLHMLDRMVGGWVRGTWRRLEDWVEAERAEVDNPNVAEWWQWLVDQLEADPDPGKREGAHIYYADSRSKSRPHTNAVTG